jgi:hypothetical protein
MLADARARYWGALNRLRALAERDYGGGGPTLATAGEGRVIAAAVAGIGLALLVPELIVVRSLADVAENLGPGIVALVGLFLVAIGAHVLRLSRRNARRRIAYDDRSAKRSTVRQAITKYADRCKGRIADGVGLGGKFLTEHWPDCAPAPLLLAQGEIRQDASEDRVTLVGEIDGRPLLVSSIDFEVTDEERAFQPPVFVVLVASPLDLPLDPSPVDGDPFRTSARPTRLEDTDCHRELTREGFVVHATQAGIAVVRSGEHAALDTEGVERIAHSVRELCRLAPASNDAPEAPVALPALDESSCGAVLVAFLGALQKGDAIGVLARAHPRLFVGRAMEPSPATIFESIDAAHARPKSWGHDVYVHASTGGSRTLDTLGEVDITEVNCINLALNITRDGGDGGANVCMLRLDGKSWQVTGYSVDSKVLLGLEFPSASG